ncbi:MAG: translation elongation factor Ts [Bacilli bacterium]
MNINAMDVKKLRDTTGAGMMDCKKALVEASGDMDGAIDYLREKGLSKVAKKAGRIAAEGLCAILIKEKDAVILELNCETDFVSKNVDFKALLETIAGSLVSSDVSSVEEALELKTENGTINDLIVNATLTIGEKLSLRRFKHLKREDTQVFGSYLHMGGQIASLILLNGGNEEVAKDTAMQAAAMKPSYVCREDVPKEEVEHESEVIKVQVIEEGKKPEFADKIIIGRLEKFYEEICLIDQTFVKDSSLSVKDYLKNNNAEVINMIRFEVGEGMEKRSDDFADEVRRQLEQ